jgi:hypothetical protein
VMMASAVMMLGGAVLIALFLPARAASSTDMRSRAIEPAVTGVA